MCASNFQTQFASEIETLYEVTDFVVRQIDPGRAGRTPVRSYTKIMSDVRATTARSLWICRCHRELLAIGWSRGANGVDPLQEPVREEGLQ